MSDAPLGVLVHGAGWVSTQHLAAYRANPHTRVLAVSSRKLDSARRRAREAGLEDAAVYDDLDRALARPGIDVVSVCTPQHLHCDNVIAAARAGKHVVIEKPVATSVEQLRRMVDEVARAGVRTVVSFVLRWNPLFRMLKHLTAAGAIGRPYYVEADYLSHMGSWWSGWEDTRAPERGVSLMLVGGCHAVDALRWFAAPGEFEAADPVEVVSVAGGWRKGSTREYNPLTHTWRDDAPPLAFDGLEVALVTFANGAVGKVSVNADCVMPYQFPLRVFGDRGTIRDNRLWSGLFPGQSDWVELPAIRPESSDVRHHPFQAQIDHFVECVREGRESHGNLADAVKTHEVVFAALESRRARRPVRLPLP